MDSLPSVLSHLSLEMCSYELVEDILEFGKTKENYEDLILMLIDSESLDSDTLEILLMSKLMDIEEEPVLMERVMDIFSILMNAPDSVLRPYQQHFITEL